MSDAYAKRAVGRTQPGPPHWAVADRFMGGTYRLTVWGAQRGDPVELLVDDQAPTAAAVREAATERLRRAGWRLLGGWQRYGDGWRIPVGRAY